MAETRLLVIIGISGLQGGSVARIFQQEPGWRIRGLTRNPSKPSNAHLKDAGIELVSGDLDDPASLDAAFKGANAIFAATDFWQFLQQPSTFSTAEKEGKKPNVVAMEREIQQGKNIIHAASKALGTLDRLVLSTLSDSKKWSSGKFEWNLHFDGKAHFTQYLKDDFPDLAKKTSYLQMGYYLSNWQMNPMFAPSKQPDGSFVLRSPNIPGGRPLPFVDPPNDTGLFVKALMDGPDAGITMLGTCEEMVFEQYAELWGKINGVKVKCEHVTLQDGIDAGLPE